MSKIPTPSEIRAKLQQFGAITAPESIAPANVADLVRPVVDLVESLPETIAESITDDLNDKIGAENGIAPLDEEGKVPAGNLPALGRAVIEFSGFVSGVSVQAAGAAKRSTDEGCSVVYDADHQCFLLEVTHSSLEFPSVGVLGADDLEQQLASGANVDVEGSGEILVPGIGALDPVQPILGATKYYSAWLDSEEFGANTANGPQPEGGKLFVCTSTRQLYLWNGTELESAGTAAELGEAEGMAYPGNKGAQLAKEVGKLSDCIVDLGVVASADAAFEAAAKPIVVNNPKIRMIQWRTSDETSGGGRGLGGTIFQVRHGNWYVVQWIMFYGAQRLCQARCITTGGNHTVGPWQELVLPVSMSYEASSRIVKASGLLPGFNGPAAKSVDLLTLPLATSSAAGLMSSADKNKLFSLPTSAALAQSLSGKVSSVPGKGLSTHDFDTEHLSRLSNAGLYGRKSGLRYAVRNIFALTKDSDNDEIKAALTSADGQRLLETDLTYCAENGCCLFDEITNGYVMVNKATDGTMFNLIEISIPKIGAPGVTSFELPSMRVVTLLSKDDENLPDSQRTPENTIWSCKRSLQEKFAYRSNLDAKLDKQFNVIYTKEPGGDGITIFYNIDDGYAQPLTFICPSAAMAVYGTIFINGLFNSQGKVLLGQTSTDSTVTAVGAGTHIGNGVTLPDNFTLSNSEDIVFANSKLSIAERAKRQVLIDMWNEAWGSPSVGAYDPDNAPDPEHPFRGNGIYMTYAEALAVMNAGRIINNAGDFYRNFPIRTNLPRLCANSALTYSYTFYMCKVIEIASCAVSTLGNSAFQGCVNLREVIGSPYGAYSINGANSPSTVFQGCVNLEYVDGSIRGNYNIDVRDCPKLTLNNFKKWLNGAVNTAPITITVHPDVYAKLTDLAQWAALVPLAAEKNIQFATI